MNSVVLIGRLTKDPETRFTTEGMAVCKFTLAIDRESSKEKQTDFPRIVVFGKQAENCDRYLHKGKQCGVLGRIQTGSYENNEGQKVYTVDVIADRVEFLGGREPEQADGEPQAEMPEFNTLDEDIPF